MLHLPAAASGNLPRTWAPPATHTEQDNDPLGSEPIIYIPAAQADARLIAVVHVWVQPSWIPTSGWWRNEPGKSAYA